MVVSGKLQEFTVDISSTDVHMNNDLKSASSERKGLPVNNAEIFPFDDRHFHFFPLFQV